MSFQIGSAYAATQTGAGSDTGANGGAAYDLDPNALQKPNRSGKGGKLDTQPADNALSIGGGQALQQGLGN